MIDVCIEHFQVSNLISGEVRPQHLPRMRPRSPISGKYPLPEERCERCDPARSETELLELQSLNGFQVLRLDRNRDRLGQHFDLKGIHAETSEPLSRLGELSMLIQRLTVRKEDIESQNWIGTWTVHGRLASVLFDHPAP